MALKAAEKELAAAYGRKCIARGESSFVADLTHGRAALWPWQPIVFTRTDYAALPPKIREGQVATIFSIDRRKSTVQALLPDGQLVSISTRKIPWFRSGFALSIREARQLRGRASLRVELGDVRRAWAALVLAATQHQPASVVIDPVVARNATSLATLLSGSLPGTLPTELRVMPDLNAELSAEIATWNTIEIETLPEPRAMPSGRTQNSLPVLLTDNVRDFLASDQRTSSAFDLLCELLHPDNGAAEEVAAKLQTVCSPNGLTMYAVDQIRDAYQPTKDSSRKEDDLDMPRELAMQNPSRWSKADVSLFKLDLFFMFFRGSNIDITSIAANRDFRGR